MPPLFSLTGLKAVALPVLGLCLAGQAALASGELPTANVIMGGAERRCSSFSGSAKSPDCTADWDTILRNDPALQGLALDDVLFGMDYPEPVWTYQLTAHSLQALRLSPNSLIDPKRKSTLLAHLAAQLQLGEATGLGWQALQDKLATAPAQPSLGLTAAEWSVVRNALLEPGMPIVRKFQARSTAYSANTASVALFRQLVDAARTHSHGAKPRIGVVTASAGPHPFVDRDLNVYALQSAGAEVVYIPLDGGLRQALDAGDCTHLRYYYDSYASTSAERPVLHGHLMFPDLAAQQMAMCANDGAMLNATLKSLHGIYFSGGNQARHLESLVGRDTTDRYTRTSAQWHILQRRHALGQLVVAGTSAGNHIQGGGLWRSRPVPMIGGGDAYDVLKNGYALGQGPAGEVEPSTQQSSGTRYPAVIYPDGGLGVFRFGVLDSHFSKRTREARLIRAALNSAMDYGFGVDENTALLVSQTDTAGTTHFSVVGAGGVFIADVRAATSSRWQTTPALVVQGVLAHYLLPGDTARIDASGQLTVTLSPTRPVLGVQLGVQSTPLQATQSRVLDYGSGNFLRLASRMGFDGAISGFGTTEDSQDPRTQQQSPRYSARLQRTPTTVFRGMPAQDGAPAQLAYTELRVGFAPCDGSCQGVDNP
ncbi:MAG: hypothetical protein CFE43_10990 [Burkholderiales bacterium PBB3]|nr:MAG: hypothetical protein CFE43_10990 [Burkholderiales bacterium PBB3]